MQVSTYSRLDSGEFMRAEYLPLHEVRLHPRLRLLHETWLQAGGCECEENFLVEIMCVAGGWVAKMKPNPADIVIMETNKPGRKPRIAWSNTLRDEVLMIDMVLCRETKEPIFQYLYFLAARECSYFQLLLPGRDRIYGLRQDVVPTPGRMDIGRTVKA